MRIDPLAFLMSATFPFFTMIMKSPLVYLPSSLRRRTLVVLFMAAEGRNSCPAGPVADWIEAREKEASEVLCAWKTDAPAEIVDGAGATEANGAFKRISEIA